MADNWKEIFERLRSIDEKLTQLSTEFKGHKEHSDAAQKDHETRLRVLEQVRLKTAGFIAGVSVVTSILVSALISLGGWVISLIK